MPCQNIYGISKASVNHNLLWPYPVALMSDIARLDIRDQSPISCYRQSSIHHIDRFFVEQNHNLISRKPIYQCKFPIQPTYSCHIIKTHTAGI